MTSPVAPVAPLVEGETRRRRGLGWLLLVPGMLWLAVFFLFPTVQLFFTSLYDPSGSYVRGYSMTWHFQNYVDAVKDTWELFVRSFAYAGIATVICLLLGYPLAYAIAFKAGRWKNVMLVQVDKRLVEAAGDLYSSPFTGFRTVTLPLSMPGVVAGTLLTFIPASGDYINAEFLGTPKQHMVGNRIQSAFLTEHDYPLAATLSILLMAIVVVMVVAYVRRAGTEDLV